MSASALTSTPMNVYVHNARCEEACTAQAAADKVSAIASHALSGPENLNSFFSTRMRDFFVSIRSDDAKECFFKHLTNIERAYKDDPSITRACARILNLYRTLDFGEQLAKAVFDEKAEKVVIDDMLRVLEAITRGTTAIRTPEQTVRRCLNYKIPFKAGILVYDAESKSSRGLLKEEFEEVMRKVQEDFEKEVRLEAFKQQYVEPVEKAVSTIKEAFSANRGVGLGLVFGAYLGCRVVTALIRNS